MLRITAIIPAYNAAAYVVEALNTIASQTRLPDEIIVVDDGSTDGTVDMVREWICNSDLNIHLVRQKNKGAPSAQNNALRQTQSDLVAILDSDDIWFPNCLEILEQSFHANPELVCCFGDAEVFNASGLICDSFFRDKVIQSFAYEEGLDGSRIITNSVFSSLLIGSYIPTCSALLSRFAIERVGGFNEDYLNAYDQDLLLRISRIGRFAYYPSVLSRIRRHEKNLTHGRNAVRIQKNSISVLANVLRDSSALNLSSQEIERTVEAATIHIQELFYQASLEGFQSYRLARRFLKEVDLKKIDFEPRHLLRALSYSILRVRNDS